MLKSDISYSGIYKMKYTIQTVALTIFIALSSVPAFAVIDIKPMYNQITKELQCLCNGCNSTVAACPHNSCGYAVPAREKIKEMLNAGSSYQEVIDYFVDKHGEVALSAPTKKGFNLVGYVMPFLAIVVAGSGIVTIASRWVGKGAESEAHEVKHAPAVGPADAALSDKLKKELNDFDA